MRVLHALTSKSSCTAWQQINLSLAQSILRTNRLGITASSSHGVSSVTISNSYQSLENRALVGALLICWVSGLTAVAGPHKQPSRVTEIPSADYASRAKGIIRALYPGLAPPPRMTIIDGLDWDAPGAINVFYVELCDISFEQLKASGLPPCPKPVLKAYLAFDFRKEEKELADIYLTGPAPRGRQDEFAQMMRGHNDWSKEQVVEALKAAGAKYGPDKKQQAIKALPLAELRPYMGDLKVESARFYVTDSRDWEQDAKLWGGCVWLVPITATARSGNKTHYIFVVEPFGGRVISIWTILHPTSPDFPSFPPLERPPSSP